MDVPDKYATPAGPSRRGSVPRTTQSTSSRGQVANRFGDAPYVNPVAAGSVTSRRAREPMMGLTIKLINALGLPVVAEIRAFETAVSSPQNAPPITVVGLRRSTAGW